MSAQAASQNGKDHARTPGPDTTLFRSVTGRADPSSERRPTGLGALGLTARGGVIAAARCQPRPLPRTEKTTPVHPGPTRRSSDLSLVVLTPAANAGPLG